MTTPDLTTPLRRGDLMLVRSYVRAALRTDPDARVPAAMLARVLATYDHDCARAEATAADLLSSTSPSTPGIR
ncbi:MAG TPA: hypothetical protein VFM71_13790 [Gemmatimonadaceae bacterium]|nr:hypothetical protein [Gemmatimonadaceae bacterium]